MEKSNLQKGITLVALVITIIVMLILLGVILEIVLGNGGIIQKVEDARKQHEIKSIEEKIQNVKLKSYIDLNIGKDLTEEQIQQLLDDLNNIEKIDSVIYDATLNEITISYKGKLMRIDLATGEDKVLSEDGIELPKQYQRIEYLENTGTDYIDTGILYADGIQMITDIQFVTLTSTTQHMGFSSSRGRWCGVLPDGNFTVGSNTTTNGNSPALERNIITFIPTNSESTLTMNEELVSSVSSPNTSLDATYTYKLFYVPKTGVVDTYPSYCKIFKHTVILNGEVIQQLIPCYNKGNGEAGMYDLVTNKFYVKRGTLKTEANIESFSDGIVLPDEYERVGYIENTGNQYIDTGILYQNGIELTTDLQFVKLTSSIQHMGFSSVKRRWWGVFSDGNFTAGNNTTTNGSSSALERNIVKFKVTSSNCSLHINDGIILTASSPNTTLDATATYKLFFIPRISASYAETNPCYCKIFKHTATLDGETIQQLIPCCRKSDKELGMYDTVTGNFYYDQTPKGNFVLGPDI